MTCDPELHGPLPVGCDDECSSMAQDTAADSIRQHDLRTSKGLRSCKDGNVDSFAESTEASKAPEADCYWDGNCCCQPPEKVEKNDYCSDNLKKGKSAAPLEGISSGSRNGCCNTLEKAKNGNIICEAKAPNVDDHCGPVRSNEQDCKKGCCPEPNVETSSTPICCENKSYPCCDMSCIDRIALRECSIERAQPNEPNGRRMVTLRPSACCEDVESGKPCDRHRRTTRAKYAPTLEALGCICRALIALGQESCCAPQQRSFLKKRSSITFPQSNQRVFVNSCCAGGANTRKPTSKEQFRPGQCSQITYRGAQANICVGDCCGQSSVSKVIESCNSIAKQDAGDSTVSGKSGIHDFAKDLPKEEHIVLSISGMSCTGCETKLKRTLAPLKSVKNLKTSLVLARAEFDIDSSAGSTAEVIKHLERTTEFKCERIRDKGSNITFTVPSDSSHFLNQDWPRGVTEITTLDQTTINVTFDTKITGPRELMENGWNAPLGLALPREDPTLETSSKHVRHMGYMTLLSIFLTVPVLVLAWAPLPERKVVYGSVSLALTSVIQFVVAGPFYPKALKSLIFSRILEMDLLIVLSTTAAFIYSVVSFGYVTAGQPLPTDEFFETSALLVTLIMVGRYVAALARQKAIESISLRSLQTSTAILVDECGGNEQEIDSRLLQHGDFFKVLPDSTIPTDGTVILGSSEVDESMVTGETIPVEKYHKSTVIAGSINGSGTLIVRLTRLPGDNTITVITEMVDEAKLSKPRTQKIADRVAGYFVPAVVALTIFTFVIWTSIGVAVQNQPGSEATIRAITYAITVLIVSCPCAIGLAVPMVMVVASGVAAERGVIFKSADSIEVAYKASHAVFDKTGTLTHGKLTVVHEKYLGESPRSSMSLLLGLIGDVKHPVATAVAAHIKAKDITSSVVLDSKALTGKGVKGTSSGHVLRAGNSRWLNVSSNTYVQWVLAQGCTAFCFTIDDSLVAVFGLKDSLRADSLQTVTKLQEHGISVHIVSGDDEGAVRSVASMLNVPNTNIRSQCTPANKQEYIQALLSISKRKVIGKRYEKAVVIFCGDGTNDAVALSQATIGVHMHEGTDVAKSAADVVLMRPGLTGILTMLAISEKSMRRIKFNFAWSFVYNLFAILLGAGAFVNARIPPGFAGLGELVSVVPVITAAVLLRWSKI